LHDEVKRLLPGHFITVDNPDAAFGVDAAAIQHALNARKSVLVHVDAGMTKVSRSTFLRKLRVTSRAMYPVPNVVLVVADDWNRTGGEACVMYGVSQVSRALFTFAHASPLP